MGQTLGKIEYFKDRIKALGPFFPEDLAIEIFRWQAHENSVYREYLSHLGIRVEGVVNLQQIPYLPIAFFKSHPVRSIAKAPQKTFLSSGTTGNTGSRHMLSDLDFYRQQARRSFETLYGPLEDYFIAALLPSYLEREGASLVFMVQDFIGQSGDADSGFFLNNLAGLSALLQTKREKKTLLLGVSFALLDLAEQYPQDLSSCIVMETGGMKGRRREMTRQALHEQLKQAFNISAVHSEYGMTELLSQAYSQGEGLFQTPSAMQISIRQTDDPFSRERKGKTGGVDVIDLANLESCCFLQTQDLGRLYEDGRFSIMGRFDHSDIRGCNLMVI